MTDERHTHRLRRQRRTQPIITRALGTLQQRYGLPATDTAFTLLRDTSQHHNLRLHTLAAAFLAAAPATTHADRWFPGRGRHAAPPLTFASRSIAREANRAAVLDALLDAVCTGLDTNTADLQTIDLADGDLRLERHLGLSADILDLVDSPAYADTAPASAVRTGQRTMIRDVATDPLFHDRRTRTVMLASGFRAMQSTPLVTPSGRRLGTVSTHHARAGRTFSTTERTRLDTMTTQLGSWLEWYQRTVVLDALEHLHHAARRHTITDATPTVPTRTS